MLRGPFLDITCPVLAASLLGMNRDQLRYHIDKFGLKEHQNAKGSR